MSKNRADVRGMASFDALTARTLLFGIHRDCATSFE